MVIIITTQAGAISHLRVSILIGWVSGLWLTYVCSGATVILVRLSVIDNITVAVAVSMATAGGKWVSADSRVGFIKAILGEFLVEGIAVDA